MPPGMNAASSRAIHSSRFGVSCAANAGMCPKASSSPPENTGRRPAVHRSRRGPFRDRPAPGPPAATAPASRRSVQRARRCLPRPQYRSARSSARHRAASASTRVIRNSATSMPEAGDERRQLFLECRAIERADGMGPRRAIRAAGPRGSSPAANRPPLNCVQAARAAAAPPAGCSRIAALERLQLRGQRLDDLLFGERIIARGEMTLNRLDRRRRMKRRPGSEAGMPREEQVACAPGPPGRQFRRREHQQRR